MIHVKEEKIERVTLTVVELAQLLGVTETSIYKMVREGQVPHFRVRKKILFNRNAIENWMVGEK